MSVAVVKSDILWEMLQNKIRQRMRNGYFTSLPLIRKEDNNYYMTCFVSDLSTMQEFNGKKYVKRPTEWVMVDLQNGNNLVYNYSSVKDFITVSRNEYLPIYSLKGLATGLVEKCLTEIMGVQAKLFSGQPFSLSNIDSIINNYVVAEYKPYYNALRGDLNE